MLLENFHEPNRLSSLIGLRQNAQQLSHGPGSSLRICGNPEDLSGSLLLIIKMSKMDSSAVCWQLNSVPNFNLLYTCVSTSALLKHSLAFKGGLMVLITLIKTEHSCENDWLEIFVVRRNHSRK